MPSPDWGALLARVGPGAEELRRRVPLVWALLHEGVALEEQDGRLVALCPFHPDTRPSFDVWGEAQDRCGCWACDFGPSNDIFGFMMRHLGVDFSEAVRYVQGLERELEGRGVPELPRNTRPRARVDLTVVERAREHRNGALGRLLALKGLRVPEDWLRAEFHVGELGLDTVVAPHGLGLAHGFACTGYKTRVPGSQWRGAPGSVLDHPYGGWRTRPAERVVVTEGETDTWCVAHWLRDEPVDVLGVPSGAQSGSPEWLRGYREVVLFLDGDAAGRGAAARLRAALEADGSARVFTVDVPDGQDACSWDGWKGEL